MAGLEPPPVDHREHPNLLLLLTVGLGSTQRKRPVFAKPDKAAPSHHSHRFSQGVLMTDTAVLSPGQGTVARPVSRAVTPARALAGSAALVGLGAMHFALDGLTSVLVTLQPDLAVRTGARPAMLSLVVGAALATASLLQPLAARLTNRFGE